MANPLRRPPAPVSLRVQAWRTPVFLAMALALPTLVTAGDSGRWGWGMSINYGSFFLKGNKGGQELLATGREKNQTDESESYGMGLVGSYRVWGDLEIEGEINAAWATESLGDAYLLYHSDLGLKYNLDLLRLLTDSDGGISLAPSLGYSHLRVNGLKVGSGEYDYSAHGLYYGLSLNLGLGKRLSYTLGADKNTYFTFDAADDGVDMENTPSVHRYYFNFKIWM